MLAEALRRDAVRDRVGELRSARQVANNGAGGVERRAGVADRAEVARRRDALHAAGDQALEVADARERVAQPSTDVACNEQRFDGVEPARDVCHIDERLVQARAQQSHTHRRPRRIEQLQE